MHGSHPSPIVHCSLAPSPLAWLLSHWSYSTDSKTCLILVSRTARRPGATVSGMRAAHNQICQLFWLFVSLSTRLIGRTIIVKTRSWSMKTWTFDRGPSVTWHYVSWTEERGTWYANHRMCAQVNMSVMSTEINLISNRKNCQAGSGAWRAELCTNDCGIVKLLDLSFSQLSKEIVPKNKLLVQFIKLIEGS